MQQTRGTAVGQGAAGDEVSPLPQPGPRVRDEDRLPQRQDVHGQGTGGAGVSRSVVFFFVVFFFSLNVLRT